MTRGPKRQPHTLALALAGMVAHIHHDLPIAVLTTCDELGVTPADELTVGAMLV